MIDYQGNQGNTISLGPRAVLAPIKPARSLSNILHDESLTPSSALAETDTNCRQRPKQVGLALPRQSPQNNFCPCVWDLSRTHILHLHDRLTAQWTDRTAPNRTSLQQSCAGVHVNLAIRTGAGVGFVHHHDRPSSCERLHCTNSE